MSIANTIQHRADVMFSELKGIALTHATPEELEQKDMGTDTEVKGVRRVRTPAGVRRFKQPIGSIIVGKGRKLANLTILDPIYDDWDLVADKKGKRYDIGQDGGKWKAFGHNDWDDLVAEGGSEEEVFENLDKKLAGPTKAAADRRRVNVIASRPTLTEKQTAEVNALNEAGQARYWDQRTPPRKETHASALRAAKVVGRNAAAREARGGPTDDEMTDARKTLPTMTKRNEYKRLRAKGVSHEEALKQAKAYRAPKADPDAEKRQWTEDQRARRELGDVRASVPTRPSRAQQIANTTQGANKPRAERTDAEIEAGLNNAFREQYDTLSSSQKRKYLAAFRAGKTHSESMSAARGGSGKAQGTLF